MMEKLHVNREEERYKEGLDRGLEGAHTSQNIADDIFSSGSERAAAQRGWERGTSIRAERDAAKSSERSAGASESYSDIVANGSLADRAGASPLIAGCCLGAIEAVIIVQDVGPHPVFKLIVGIAIFLLGSVTGTMISFFVICLLIAISDLFRRS